MNETTTRAETTETRTNHACLPCQDAAGTGLWLQNNAWGFEGEHEHDHPPQVVRVGPAAPGRDAGQSVAWAWDWPSRGGADDERVIAYPGVICGRKPFGHLASSTPVLPMRLARVGSLAVEHDLRLHADGGHNAAFDLWLTRGPDAGADGDGAGVLAEVMVWLYNRRMHPAGAWVETVSTPHGPARLFVGAVRHWRCLTFVLDTPRLRGPTDLGFFLRCLGERRLLPGGEAGAGAGADGGAAYLASVELGTEIYYGRGRAELRHLRVRLDQIGHPRGG